jgi:hypothetical protein
MFNAATGQQGQPREGRYTAKKLAAQNGSPLEVKHAGMAWRLLNREIPAGQMAVKKATFYEQKVAKKL